MTDLQIKIEILKLPIGVVLGAYALRGGGTFPGTPAEQKSKAADYLVSCVRANSLTLADIKAATPVAVSAVQGADTAAVDAVGSVANRAEAAALKAIEAVKRFHD